MKHTKNTNKNKLYMVYGLNSSLAILKSSLCKNIKFIVSKTFLDTRSDFFSSIQDSGNIVKILSDANFNNEFDGLRTQGIVVHFNYPLQDYIPSNNQEFNQCYLILDSIKDPQNLGQIIRTSECAGIDGIIFPERRSVGITNTVLQVSQGGFCNLDLIEAKNIKYLINELKEDGFWVIGIENSIEAKNWYEVDMKGKVAFVLGSEELNQNSKLSKPYTKGRSSDLLLGLAPYFDPGTRSPRNDVPSPEGGEIWDQMKEWHVDADFMWKKGARIRDFWILHSSM